MKIRNGFVSDSSSSSFTCDVCGTTESGMDASPQDFDMETCINGHTFCNDHAPESEPMTPQQYRDTIREQIKACTWLDKKRIGSDIAEMEAVPDDEIEEFYSDNYSSDGVPECQCPICTFKALSQSDAFVYLKKKFSMEDSDILETVKANFKTYGDFNRFLEKK